MSKTPFALPIFLSTHILGGLTWAFNTQLYIQEYYPDFNPGYWVTIDSIVGGRYSYPSIFMLYIAKI